MNRILTTSIITLSISLLGCGVYTFTGASLDPRIETISIQYFFDEVGAGPPTISQQFTEDLKDYFQRNTTLKLVDNGGDIQLEGSITGYSTNPITARSGGNQSLDNADVSSQERLKITVNVSYINQIDESKDFNRAFSFYRDYNPETEPLISNEQEYVDEIVEQIILDIFNATVQDW